MVSNYETFYKIGIISPRTYSTGSHDPNSDLRTGLGKKIEEILLALKKERKFIVGVSSLTLGLEQDFCDLCLKNEIDYMCFIAHEKQEEQWRKLPNYIYEKYIDLIKSSLSITQVGDGVYSPRKVFRKHNRLINYCDAIILIDSPMIKYDPLAKMLKKKRVFRIPWNVIH